MEVSLSPQPLSRYQPVVIGTTDFNGAGLPVDATSTVTGDEDDVPI